MARSSMRRAPPPISLRVASAGIAGRPAVASAWLIAGARSRLVSTSVPSRSKPTIWNGKRAMAARLGAGIWKPQPNGGIAPGHEGFRPTDSRHLARRRQGHKDEERDAQG